MQLRWRCTNCGAGELQQEEGGRGAHPKVTSWLLNCHTQSCRLNFTWPTSQLSMLWLQVEMPFVQERDAQYSDVWNAHIRRKVKVKIYDILQDKPLLWTRSLGALQAPTSSWRPFWPLDFVLCAFRALRTVRRARLRSGPVNIGHFWNIGHFCEIGAFINSFFF